MSQDPPTFDRAAAVTALAYARLYTVVPHPVISQRHEQREYA